MILRTYYFAAVLRDDRQQPLYRSSPTFLLTFALLYICYRMFTSMRSIYAAIFAFNQLRLRVFWTAFWTDDIGLASTAILRVASSSSLLLHQRASHCHYVVPLLKLVQKYSEGLMSRAFTHSRRSASYSSRRPEFLQCPSFPRCPLSDQIKQSSDINASRKNWHRAKSLSHLHLVELIGLCFKFQNLSFVAFVGYY